MSTKPKILSVYVLLVGFIILAIDIITPLGFATWLFYILLIISASFQLKKLPLLILCGVLTIFIIIRLLLAPLGTDLINAIVNRTLIIIILWASAVFMIRYISEIDQHRITGERFKVFQDFSLDAFTILKSIRDKKGKIIDFEWEYVNKTAAKYLKGDPEEFIGKRLLVRLPGNLESGLFHLYVKVVEENASHDLELFYEHEGIKGWFRNMAVKMGDSVAISFKDITEQKNRESELEKANKTIKEVLDRVSDSFLALDNQWRFTFLNSSVKKYNIFTDELIGKNIWESFPKFKGTILEKSFCHAMANQIPVNFEIKGIYYDNWLRITSYPSSEGLTVYAKDITNEKKIQFELEKAHITISSILESITDYFYVVDNNWRIMYQNSISKTDTGGDAFGRILWECWPFIKGTAVEENLRKSKEHNYPVNFQFTSVKTSRHFNMTAYPFPEGLSVYSVDITGKLEIEKKLTEALAEKETLLKEIHHRVKNNLQIISSILSLQADYSKNGEYRTLIDESKTRIRSMSLIHEMLHKSKTLSDINFGTYIKELMVYIAGTFSTEKNIRITPNIEEVSLNIEKSINLGLIMNELLSNCYKYAFRDMKSGEIKISLHQIDTNWIYLAIEDNGVGMPENFNPQESQSLGMQLVFALVDQLRAKIEIHNNKGTSFVITAPCS